MCREVSSNVTDGRTAAPLLCKITNTQSHIARIGLKIRFKRKRRHLWVKVVSLRIVFVGKSYVLVHTLFNCMLFI